MDLSIHPRKKIHGELAQHPWSHLLMQSHHQGHLLCGKIHICCITEGLDPIVYQQCPLSSLRWPLDVSGNMWHCLGCRESSPQCTLWAASSSAVTKHVHRWRHAWHDETEHRNTGTTIRTHKGDREVNSLTLGKSRWDIDAIPGQDPSYPLDSLCSFYLCFQPTLCILPFPKNPFSSSEARFLFPFSLSWKVASV